MESPAVLWTVAARHGLLCPSVAHNSAPEGASLSIPSVPQIKQEQLKMNETHTALTCTRVAQRASGVPADWADWSTIEFLSKNFRQAAPGVGALKLGLGSDAPHQAQAQVPPS